MPYTLLKYLLWLLGAFLLGMAIAYYLWGRRTVTQTVDVDVVGERDKLRGRVANLEAAVADRDRLASELADCKASAKLAAAAPKAEPMVAAQGFAGVAQSDHDGIVAAHEATISDLRARLWNAETKVGELQGLVDAQGAASVPPAPDVSTAEAVLGKKIKLDDLKVVEGIGPKIDELCAAKGISTWWGLSTTDPATLRAMLDEAGPRFQMHDPSTWPQQAGLLARGLWAEFKELTDRLDGGKAE